MSIFADPRKAKIAFVLVLIFMIIFLAGGGVLGYFYYKKNVESYDLFLENRDLKGQQEIDAAKLEKQVKTLTDEKTALEKQVNDNKAGSAKIKAYNEFSKYLNSVIEVHGGYSGWTEAEYQTARTKAQATGDSSFVTTIDWAWHRTDIDPTTRMIRVLKEVAEGIDSGL